MRNARVYLYECKKNLFIVLFYIPNCFMLFIFMWLREAAYIRRYDGIYRHTVITYVYIIIMHIHDVYYIIMLKWRIYGCQNKRDWGQCNKKHAGGGPGGFFPEWFSEKRRKKCFYVYICCTCIMRIIHLYNVTRFMYRNGWTHKSHRSYFSPWLCYFLFNSHRFFACFHYYNIIYSPWHSVVFWSKKQFGSGRMI